MAEGGAADRELLDRLAQRGIEVVALSFVDNAGVARAKAVPAEALPRALVAGVGSPRVLGVFTGNDAIAPAGELSLPVGDLRLVPDLDALAGGVDGWGWAPADQRDQEGNVWPLCPRALLRRTVDAAAARGFELRLAFELEWYAEDAAGVPVHDGPAYSAAALGDAGEHLAAVAARLALHGIAAQQVHAEYSPGQLEASLAGYGPAPGCGPVRPRPPRHPRRRARTAGLRASFSPLTYPGMVGNGCHLHVSLWRGDANLLGPGEDGVPADPAGRAFLAGHAPRAAGSRGSRLCEPALLPPPRPHALDGCVSVLGSGEPGGAAALHPRLGRTASGSGERGAEAARLVRETPTSSPPPPSQPASTGSSEAPSFRLRSRSIRPRSRPGNGTGSASRRSPETPRPRRPPSRARRPCGARSARSFTAPSSPSAAPRRRRAALADDELFAYYRWRY